MARQRWSIKMADNRGDGYRPGGQVRCVMSVGIICADGEEKLVSGKKYSALRTDSDFLPKTRQDRNLSLSNLQDNNCKNARVASLIRQYDPVLAARLTNCSVYVQRQSDGSWRSSRYCRLNKLCLTCQAVRSQQLRQQFEEAAVAFEVATQARLRLCSFVLHPQIDPDLDSDTSATLCLQAIEAFGLRFAKWRTNQNARWLLAADGKAGRRSCRGLIGPAMLATHIEPSTVIRVAGRRIVKQEKSHLHLLLAMPNKFPVRDFQQTLYRLWKRNSGSLPLALDVVITKKKLVCENAEHVSNLIAYAARPLKARWSPEQTFAAYSRLQYIPRRAVIRVLGATTDLMSLPHRIPLTGEMLEFSQDEMQFVSCFKKGWV